MSDFLSGNRTTFDGAGNDVLLDLRDGLDFLNPRNDGIGLLKMLGLSGITPTSTKHEWTETALATRRETVTLADGSGTTLTVANAKQYQVNDLIRIEAEIVRVTAIASATTLTIVRGYAGTTGAAHSAKTAVPLGSADPENSAAPAGISDDGDRLYNYVQTFTRAVDLSNDEIAAASTDGNPLTGQVERRYIEFMRLIASSMFNGVRYNDTTNKLRVMGGLKQFVTTNVTNVAGALAISNIDAQILAIVQAGADPGLIVTSPYQKQKLDALDANKQYLGKSEHTGGNLVTNTWQSGVLDHPLPVMVDQTIANDELWILTPDMIKLGCLSRNGVVGTPHVEDATTPGQDGKKRVMRAKVTMEVVQQKAHGYLYGLS